jgi:hypothetical protein
LIDVMPGIALLLMLSAKVLKACCPAGIINATEP